ncbi:maleylpyruvate isomerase family mycothiol-dependent enzyme [Streptomyces ipomoeae]|uniref:maleylpyruvate isomerase family mycothiol-dependent enzyme n=1 Tax=Streptomyces ipomoeae TaxID=103232 RepID=UPI00114707B8|nr:maleylpyruvate isomerase family mycothiol-dependent enzyme [Streptomyces ipomoeae]MDX2934288.1 maleylpyruvate isomerase family mycothiol-dependent enzyme [Streptomyces ipomoeae]TQE30136.1 maleylpyruvate isomerase family mycothiol-dependent enzyme [Streptomyces ipomoeae]
MTLLAHDRYCDEIAHQVGLLRSVVTSGADLSITVPTCPDWTLEQLVRHVGGALRWVELTVRTRAEEEISEERVPGFGGPEGEGDAGALDVWLAETGEMLVGALREAGPDAKVWGWAGVLNAGFWARRMTHEITVHRADAALAAGLRYEVAPDVAADAIDEWLEIIQWAQRTLPKDPARESRRPGSSIHLHATDNTPDVNAEWFIDLSGDVVAWRRGHEKATVALRGPLTEVLLAFYRRLPPDGGRLEVLGERDVLDSWLERSTFG